MKPCRWTGLQLSEEEDEEENNDDDDYCYYNIQQHFIVTVKISQPKQTGSIFNWCRWQTTRYGIQQQSFAIGSSRAQLRIACTLQTGASGSTAVKSPCMITASSAEVDVSPIRYGGRVLWIKGKTGIILILPYHLWWDLCSENTTIPPVVKIWQPNNVLDHFWLNFNWTCTQSVKFTLVNKICISLQTTLNSH